MINSTDRPGTRRVPVTAVDERLAQLIIDAITVVSDSVTAHHYILRCYLISSYVYRDRMKSINEQLNRQTWNPTGSSKA